MFVAELPTQLKTYKILGPDSTLKAHVLEYLCEDLKLDGPPSGVPVRCQIHKTAITNN